MKKRSGAGRRKPGTGPRLALAIVTCLNLALTLALAVMRRQDTLRAVRGDGSIRLLLDQGTDTAGRRAPSAADRKQEKGS